MSVWDTFAFTRLIQEPGGAKVINPTLEDALMGQKCSHPQPQRGQGVCSFLLPLSAASPVRSRWDSLFTATFPGRLRAETISALPGFILRKMVSDRVRVRCHVGFWKATWRKSLCQEPRKGWRDSQWLSSEFCNHCAVMGPILASHHLLWSQTWALMLDVYHWRHLDLSVLICIRAKIVMRIKPD
jgi:hypothetical protein